MRDVAIIGPGRVGGALALAFGRRGDRVVAVAGRPGSASLRRFTALVPDVAVRPVEEVAAGVDLVVVTVPDDAIEPVARAAARAGGVEEGQRWIHTSGAHGVAPLALVAAAGGRVAACHPAMTVPDPERGADQLVGASWAVTAAPPDIGWARVLVTDLRGSPVTLPEERRTLYHAGLAVGSNATASVVVLARDLLLGAGVSDPAAFLGPLVASSVAGAVERGAEALTGPVRRGDAGTVEAHLQELETALPEAVDAYLVLGELLLGQARRAGLDPAAADRVREIIASGRQRRAAGGGVA